jgi:hypothetical protein
MYMHLKSDIFLFPRRRGGHASHIQVIVSCVPRISKARCGAAVSDILFLPAPLSL